MQIRVRGGVQVDSGEIRVRYCVLFFNLKRGHLLASAGGFLGILEGDSGLREVISHGSKDGYRQARVGS